MDAQHLSVQCTAVVFNSGCGCSFHHHGDLTHHLHYFNVQPKIVRNILNVPVEEFSINRLTSHSIQSTACSTFCPEVSQGQAINLY